MSWCDRALILGPYFTLITSEKELLKEMQRSQLPREEWVTMPPKGAGACTSKRTINNKPCCIVTMDMERSLTKEPIQVAALLVHEAVHVWQYFIKDIGEFDESWEFEAYSIQHISQELMYKYKEQLEKHLKAHSK